jgi:hypothetical protein
MAAWGHVPVEVPMTDITAGAIRAFRQDASLSITEAARELARTVPPPPPALDSLVRAWKRWEAGTRPSRAYQALLRALIAARTPGATPETAPDLSGEWWAAWETVKDAVDRVDVHTVRLRRTGTTAYHWWSVTRAVPVEQGGYLWFGDLTLHTDALIGHYLADDGAVRSKGAVYLALHPHGQVMNGRWVGMSHDGPVIHGLGVMARTRPQCVDTMQALRDSDQAG